MDDETLEQAIEEVEQEPELEPVGLQDASQEQIYEVIFPYRPPGDIRLYMPGAILNLSHLTREQIHEALDNHWIMTADGVPGNRPLAEKAPCKRC